MQLFTATQLAGCRQYPHRKMKVIQATHLADVQNLERSAVRGQYSAGWMKGKRVPGYREEPVNPNSRLPMWR